MAGVIQFVRSNMALAPLFAFVGAGCAAAVAYPLHLLRSHPEIQIDKKNNPYPWHHVQQHQNIKFINAAPEFYAARKDLKSPTHSY